MGWRWKGGKWEGALREPVIAGRDPAIREACRQRKEEKTLGLGGRTQSMGVRVKAA